MSNKYSSKATQSFLNKNQLREIAKIKSLSAISGQYLENLSATEIENLEHNTYLSLRETAQNLYNAHNELTYALNEIMES